MLTLPTYELLGLATLLSWWLALRLWRRRARGRLIEVERRFEATVQKFRVEVDRFKLTRQAAVKILLNHDHEVWTHVEEMALASEGTRDELRLRVNRYVEEIVPAFMPLAYFRLGEPVARLLLNLLYKIDYRPQDVAKIKAMSQEKPRAVIYLMNHRSNADYVLAAHVLAEEIALSFAVGEWARVWPLEALFKAFGSYFLRRGFRDPLYHTVLRRYVQLVTKNGVTQALFPEGGLSRDGRLRPPKIGLLDYIVCAKEDRAFRREVLFVPVAINYDRVLEDRALVKERTSNRPERNKLLMGWRVLQILFGNAYKFARRRIRKNGVAAVRFGAPVSFDSWLAEQGTDIFSLDKSERRLHVARFCNDMMQRIAALIPATPVCVVAKVLLERTPIARASLPGAVRQEVARLSEKGVEVVGAERGAEWITEGALMRLELRDLVEEDDGDLVIPEGARDVLRYYANAIVHHDDGVVPVVENPGA